MSYRRGVALFLVLVVAGCGGGEDTEFGQMDGMIDGVPVEDLETTTTSPPATTEPTPATTAPPETTIAPEPDPVSAEGPPEVDDFALWQAEITAVCERFEPRVARRAASVVPPADLEQAAAYFDVMNPLTSRYVAAILAVPAPQSRGAEVSELYALTEELQEAADTAQAAAHFDDPGSYGDAVAALDAAAEQIDPLLTALDLPACASA